MKAVLGFLLAITLLFAVGMLAYAANEGPPVIQALEMVSIQPLATFATVSVDNAISITSLSQDATPILIDFVSSSVTQANYISVDTEQPLYSLRL